MRIAAQRIKGIRLFILSLIAFASIADVKSQNIDSVVFDLNSGGSGSCQICNSNYECNSSSGWTFTYIDSLSPGLIVTQIDVVMKYTGCSSNGNTVFKVNNTLVDTIHFTYSCNCGNCFIDTASRMSPSGFPNYKPGDTNTLQVQTNYSVCVDRFVVYIHYRTQSVNDAGVISIDTLGLFCAGNKDLYAHIGNFGINRIDSVKVNWSFNDTVQSPLNVIGTLDTIGGSGNYDTLIFLGTRNLNSLSGDKIKVWTSDPNGASDTVNINDTLTKNLIPALSGIYTIGGTSPDYSNIALAVNALNQHGVCGPVVFKIRNGTYTEQLSIGKIKGASLTNNITFESQSGDSTDVLISYFSNSSSANWVVRLNQTKYVRFSKIHLEATGTSYARVIDLEDGPEYITFNNCIISGPYASSGSNRALVYADDANGPDHLVFSNNVIKNGGYGIYMGGSYSIPMNTITIDSNEFKDQYNYGCYLYNAETVQAVGNNFSNTLTYFTAFYLDECEDFIVAYNRFVLSSGGQAIELYSCSGKTGNYSVVANNFISISSSNGGTGIYGQYLQYVDIVFNSLNVVAGSNSYALNIAYNNDIKVINNNIVSDRFAYYGWSNNNSVIDHNNAFSWSGQPNSFAYDGSVNHSDLASWNKATTYDSNSFSQDPQYLSSVELRTKNIDLNASGMAYSMIQDDIDGDTRDTLMPDIGADEFEPNALDASLIMFSQVSQLDPDLKVRVKNNGGDTITSLKIGWRIGTVNQSTVNWSGSLPSGQSSWITLDSLPFTYDSAYNLTAWSFEPNSSLDSFSGNDSITGTVAYALAGSYTIGGSAPDFVNFTAALDALKLGGISDTVVFNVRDTTYIEQLLFPSIKGTENGYPITFRSQSGDSTGVILSYTTNSYNYNYIVGFDGASNIRFERITLKTTGTSYSQLIYFRGGSENIIFSNCHLEGRSVTTTSSNNNLVFKEGDLPSSNIRFINNYFYLGSSAVYFYGYGSSLKDEHISFIHNHFVDQYYRVMYVRYQDTFEFSENMIHSNTNYVNGLYGFYGDNIEHHFKLMKNRFYGNMGQAFYLYSCNLSSGDTGIMANNFITSNIGGSTRSIYLNSNNNLTIAYNNVLLTTNDASDAALYLQWNYDLTIANNNFINLGTGYALYNYNTQWQWDYSDHNNFFTKGNSLIYYGSNRDTLGAWQASTNLDTNSISIDPEYISATDLHVENVSLNNNGIAIPFITDDIDGDTRDSVPDIGADEFTPPANDADLSRFTVPGEVFLQDTVLVTVMLRNSGLDTLKSAAVHWVVNNDTQSTVNWTGALYTGDSVAVQLGNYVFNDTTAYNLTAWSNSPNGKSDDKVSNDTVYIRNRFTSLSGVYTIGGSSPDYSDFTDALNALISRGIADSVVFNVRNGSYYEHLRIPAIAGTYFKGQIIFQSESGDSTDVTLSYSAANQDSNYVILLDGAEGLLFRNLTLQSTGASNYSTIISFLNMASDNAFMNNRIQGVATTSSSYNAALVFNLNEGGQGNVFKGNLFENGGYGIYMNNTSSEYQSHLRIENNTFENTNYSAIYLTYNLNPHIINNRINFTNSSRVNAIGINLQYCNDSLRVERNWIYHPNQGIGMQLQYCGRNSTDTGYVLNNVISLHNMSNSYYGIYLYDPACLQIMHNTIRIRGNATGSYGLYSRYGGWNRLMNNILVNEAGGYIYYFPNGSNFVAIDNNVLISTAGQDFAYYGGNYFKDLGEWQSATNYDTLSVVEDPFFFSETDLHVHSIDLHEKAIPFSFVTHDVDGDVRSSKPDIGADEFEPPLLDAGVEFFVNPVAPFVPDTLPIVLAVKNFGSQTITAFKLFWEINGSRDSLVWNDSLYSADTVHVTARRLFFDPDSVYVIKAWTSIPNGIPDTANYNDTAVVQDLAPALSGVYTIGGAAPDFATFNEAVAAMIIGGIIDSVRFDVRSGTYIERIEIPEIRGVSGPNSIIFQSENMDSSLVSLKDSALTLQENYVVYLNGADGVTFRHMTLRAVGSNYARVIWINNEASNNRFLNNRLQGSSLNSTASTNAIVYAESTMDTANHFKNNYFLNGAFGLYLYGPGSSDRETGHRVENNHFVNQYYMGVYALYMSDLRIVNNVMEKSSTYAGYYGVYCYYTYPVVITGNKINGGFGNMALYLYRSYNTSNDHGLVANNFFFKKGTSGNAAVYMYQCNYVDFIYNNIFDSSSSTTSRALYTYQGSNIRVQNNVLFSSNGYAIYRYSNGLNNCDYNDLYTGGANLGYYNGVRTDLSAWQSATGLDGNSISVDPLYNSLTDLHVGAVDLNGAGNPFTGITTDIDGEQRDTLTPDIGADEFRLPAADDAGISDLLGPVVPFASGNRSVQLEIKNHGSDTLKSATVHWTVNGNSQSSYSWSGNLSTGKTDTFSVGTFNFQSGVFNTIQAWTTSPNGQTDSINWNDTIVRVDLIAGLDGVYTIGGVAPDFATFGDAISTLEIAGVVDTVEFQVRAGTYTEQVTLGDFPGGSANRPVTFISEDSDSTKVTLQYYASYINNFVFRFSGASYVNFEQMTVKALNSYYARCLVIDDNSHHLNIRHNRLEASINTNGDADLIYSSSSNDEFIRIHNNHLNGGRYGILLYGQSSSFSLRERGNIIVDNVFTSQRFGALQVSNQNGIRISGNRISALNSGNSFTGIALYYCHDTTNVLANQITDISSGGTGTGIYFSRVQRTSAYYPLVANNVISLGGNYANGIRIYDCSELKVFYNSVNVYGTAAGTKYAALLQYSSGIQLINNILSSPGGGYAIYNSDNQLNLAISNYNDLYTSGANLCYFNGNNYSTLNAWTAAVSRDAQSISVNPNFVSNTNLHAYISSLDGKALPLSLVVRDFEGDQRDTIAPDIGADEFNSLPNNIGISAVHFPVDGCELDSAVVQIDVFNYGSLPQTGFDLVYRMNAGSAVTQNFGTTDTLGPGMSALFTFNKKQAVLTGNTYQFTIYTDLSTDQDRTTDTVTRSISNYSEPDTVRNMIPVDSAINQDFPLTLSWSPVSGATNYDVYVWQDGSSRPATPLRSGLVSISTTINQNELIVLYGKSYKWQVRAYNTYCQVWSPQNLFTVKELPDLTVSSISAPASAFSGSDITVGWTVQNDSTGVTGSTQWYDFIYLSADSTFDASDVYVGHELNKTALGQGQSYSNTKTIGIPNGYIGTRYIIISTDHYNQLNEKDNSNNRRARSIPISLTPPPDLEVTSIIKPIQAYSGTTISVQWTITNNGTGGSVSSKWYDRVYLSTDSSTGGNAIHLGTKLHSGLLAKDSSYSASLSATIPVNYSGKYYVIVRTDLYDQVYEHASEGNNVRASDSIKVILAPPPDFMATSLVHKDSASNRTWVTINYAIENNGVGDNYNKVWYDRIYISHKNTFNKDSSITLKNMYRNGTISGFGSKRYNENVLIPSTLNGMYYFYVETDIYNHIYEYDKENNNVSGASPIKVISPDLVVRNILLPVSDSSGKTIAVTYNVCNDGTGDLVNSYLEDSFYISPDSTLYAGATRLGTIASYTSIPGGDSIERTAYLTIPNGTSGKQYIHVITDRPARIYEAGKDNNNNDTASMDVVLTPWPDLVTDSLYTPADSISSGDTMSVHFTVRNDGIGVARSGHSDVIYLSLDTVLGPNDTKLETYVYADTLGVDSTYSGVVDVIIPKNTSLGTYYLILKVDANNNLYEHQRENNNVTFSDSIFVKGYPPIDLVAGCLYGPDTVLSGSKYSYNWQVTNKGDAVTPVSYWTDYIYLSTDTILDYTDPAIGQLIINEILDTNESYQSQFSVTIPNGIQGDYYLFLYTDGTDRNNDVDKSNNARILCDQNDDPVLIRINLAPTSDLEVTSLSVPTSVTAGQPFKVYYTVENNGSVKTSSGSWADRLYLSADFNINYSDYILGTKTHLNAIGVNESYTDSMEVTVPVNFAGNYVVIFKTDANNVEYEHNGENNNTDAGATLVSQAPPADLVVAEVTTSDSVGTGDQMLVSWTIRNDGSNAASGWMRDHLYLSEDTIWDGSDILIGSKDRSINIIPSGTSSQSIAVEISGVTLGTYYVIVRTDIKNNINESNDDNNAGSSDSLKVSVPELPLNVWTKDTIVNGDEIGYRIEIPNQLADESMLIELKADSVNGSNEIFLKYGQMATGANNDYTYSDPFSGNQEITVPLLDEGTYYLLIRGSSMSGSQPALIRPRILDFEIRSVDADEGGNNGKVTVLVEGSKFDSSTIFHLTSNLDTITSDTAYYVDPTLMYATFDLEARRTGTYSLVAEKESGETAIKNNCFKVVPGIPADLHINVRKPSGARTNRVVAMIVEITNNGNTDISNKELTLNSPIGAPVSFDVEGLDDDLDVLILQVEEENGPPGILRAGGSTSMVIYTYTSSALGFNIIIPDLND